MDLFKNRRFWAAVTPLAVVVAGQFGVPITEEMLTSLADKGLVFFSAGLTLWSLFAPKPPA